MNYNIPELFEKSIKQTDEAIKAARASNDVALQYKSLLGEALKLMARAVPQVDEETLEAFDAFTIKLMELESNP